MKKTLSLLIVTAICASGDIIYTSQDAQIGTYTFEQMLSTSNHTVAVTLDLTAPATSIENLFYLQGQMNQYPSIEGLILDNSRLGGFYKQGETIDEALANVQLTDWSNITDNNLPEGYTSLYKNHNTLDLSKASSVTLFLVGYTKGTYEYLTSYAYVQNSGGSIDKYTGTTRYNRKPFSNISSITVNSVAVGSIDVYDSAMTVEEIEKIALSIPEPTTATLSLLALAGLAARRRRR